MAHIKREQLAAIGIHYVYYPLDYMLDSQAKAGYKTIEMLGMAPHYLMDETGYQDPAELRKKVEARGMKIGCYTPECATYYYTMNAPEGGFHDRSMEYFKRGLIQSGGPERAAAAGLMGYLFFAFLFFGLLKGSGLLRGKLWLLFILLRLCNLFPVSYTHLCV